MKLYLKVSKDKYELPQAVAGSLQELARMCGMNPKSVSNQYYNGRCGRLKQPRFISVEVDDESSNGDY